MWCLKWDFMQEPCVSWDLQVCLYINLYSLLHNTCHKLGKYLRLLERRKVSITILHMQKYQKLKELFHKATSVELRTSIKNILCIAVDWGDSIKVTCYSRDPDFFIAVLWETGGGGDTRRNLYFLRWKQSGDSCTSRYVNYEYICEKICAVSSSAYLPFRSRLSYAQRPDGLKVTPASAGVLSFLSKYLYHLENNPWVLACSTQIVHKDVLKWGYFYWVNTMLCCYFFAIFVILVDSDLRNSFAFICHHPSGDRNGCYIHADYFRLGSAFLVPFLSLTCCQNAPVTSCKEY